MDLQHRLHIINEQERSYIMGTVENINEQWIFFDAETDEASMIEDMICKEVEVYTLHKWVRGVFVEDGASSNEGFYYKLENGDCIRFKKTLPFSYSELLKSFPEELFLKFTQTLNSLNFSLYDCLSCHNHLLFKSEDKDIHGVNFIIYDNTEILCSVHHHFSRGSISNDRFEFTLANGKRALLINLQT